MAWNADWLALIDERIRALTARSSAVGTVTARTSDTAVYVTFDGSNVSVPVKIFGDVNAYAGDRVGLQRFGSDWVVVGTYSRRYPTEVGFSSAGAGQTITSSTFTAISGVSTTLTKRDTASRLRAMWTGTAYNAGGVAVPFIGVQYVTAGSSPTTYGPYTIGTLYQSVTNGTIAGVHLASGLPAGVYTVQFMWRRASGAGTPTLTTDDWYSATVREVGP